MLLVCAHSRRDYLQHGYITMCCTKSCIARVYLLVDDLKYILACTQTYCFILWHTSIYWVVLCTYCTLNRPLEAYAQEKVPVKVPVHMTRFSSSHVTFLQFTCHLSSPLFCSSIYHDILVYTCMYKYVTVYLSTSQYIPSISRYTTTLWYMTVWTSGLVTCYGTRPTVWRMECIIPSCIYCLKQGIHHTVVYHHILSYTTVRDSKGFAINRRML